ncbi:two-component system sensor histidine kinase/response regulator [Lonsdalea britannica]|uniref:Sensor histidine kinase RcsC n=1 Tax=Lonsdalea britannica TaxID=1082704 RepID=A0AAD0SHI8_9GAMM|nr:two-component system sensor histidine kinase RcsC [Lonsdalea britannica]AXW87279.1 two-component system sensor histidine kinase RcsC [Lonsdalea britannica]OSM99796.1 two-component system sensor histidine kinase/response regulator [Lonsdalea britannica]
MKFVASFQTTLKFSRYLFRALALALWLLGALISLFYISKALNERESQLRHLFTLNADQSLGYIRRATDVARELKYMATNRLSVPNPGREHLTEVQEKAYSIYGMSSSVNCAAEYEKNPSQLTPLIHFFEQWHHDFSSVYDLNRIFFVDRRQQCLVDFGIRNQSLDSESLVRNVQERLQGQRNSKLSTRRDDSLFWVSSGLTSETGYFYALMPIYVENQLVAVMGIEQPIRLDDFMLSSDLPFSVKLLDQNNRTLMQFSDAARNNINGPYPDISAYFGYINNYNALILKKALLPTTLSVVYALPLEVILAALNSLIMNMALLNLLSAIALFVITRVLEQRMFLPAERNAFQLEENEQFNRKIVASAPVGICILRISDGANILSNELAHNYLSLLTYEDRIRVTKIICEQQSKSVDVLTSRNHHLQISFVHSRYRNENVAICVLLDVSARVRMEESLQEMANAAEQASQSKSMFLATVSHELRTPLYGIIGNLDLLQTKTLPKDANRLVTAMHNSSELLLKIISDILDFSKIESEQLKIENCQFIPREVISHVVSNYLPLVVKKRLTLYCFIEPKVPLSLSGDPVRLQQVLSNLLSNAIKFTDTGCIVFQVRCRDGYIEFLVRDTGVGINTREVMKLFDPFFQAGTGVQRHFQGTGLGLAICEKLVNLMDGDITIESAPGLGSQFGIRIPLYQAQYPLTVINPLLQGKNAWLRIRNAYMGNYLRAFLQEHGLNVQDYSGQSVAADEIVISDYPLSQNLGARAHILISGSHTGSAQEVSPGCWEHSTSAPQDLPQLLQRIYRGKEALPAPTSAAPASLSYSCDNDDIHILVVDDHPINRRLLADQLGSLGYEVVTANDGLDALDVLSKSSVDIVLTDVNMPNLDGYGFTRRMREMAMTLPVIGVTANALAEERQRCLEAGMDNCLSKPVTLDTLQQSLAYYANLVRQNNAVESKDS